MPYQTALHGSFCPPSNHNAAASDPTAVTTHAQHVETAPRIERMAVNVVAPTFATDDVLVSWLRFILMNTPDLVRKVVKMRGPKLGRSVTH
jgi:hypothetical protein